MKSQSISFFTSLGLHILLGFFLLYSFDKTIVVSSMEVSPTEEPLEIIDAVMINNSALQAEVNRLEAIEAKKREHEQAQQRELERKQKEAKENLIREQKLAAELQRKNEQLKKEAELQRIAQIQQEKERQAKLKAEAEALKKIEKDKKDALIAKQKAEEERKAAELAKQKAAQAALQKQKEIAEENARAAANVRMKQDQIHHYGMFIQNKVKQHWRQPLGMDFAGLQSNVVVRLLPTGEVVDAMVVKSSGSVEFDRSAELAVRKASPLPMPSDPDLVREFRQFNFIFKP